MRRASPGLHALAGALRGSSGAFTAAPLPCSATLSAATAAPLRRAFHPASVVPTAFTTRSFACSAGLDRPPPEEIHISYDPAHVDTFIAVADVIEDAYPTLMVVGNADGDGAAGSFEVTSWRGTVLFSRTGTTCLPDARKLVVQIGEHATEHGDDLAAARGGERSCT